ncbi:xanthine phosphoribosyltransferase [Spongiibacter sp. KMU-158]|uniref:Xanthine phosphoribosyltransferase n=1 Tax=Spongiibacter pelagi TaxID=2760804 RepID=A0A927GXE0_9GAMM|nr:xanthine phosphoribosyltransferase [Spongiibacter pelagi]MBD2860073.1 xanthine phosphoribosyltransferase [Spongiibacter pelagi]
MSDATSNHYFLSWDELHRDTRILAKKLTYKKWQGIIGIARGGLIPAAILARELNIRLMDTLCISSYDHDRQGELNVLKAVEGNGAGYLLVDDLVDTGVTAKAAQDMLPEATLVTVYAKPKAKSLAAFYARDFEQETWIHFPWDIAPSYSEPLVK